MLTINAMYRTAHVGTGVFTRGLIRALPEAAVWEPPADLTDERRAAYYRKLATEARLAQRRDVTWVHPYAALTLDPRAVISVLDLIHYRACGRVFRSVLAASARRAADLIVLSRAMEDEVRSEFGRSPFVVEPLADEYFYDAPYVRDQRLESHCGWRTGVAGPNGSGPDRRSTPWRTAWGARATTWCW